MNGHEVEVDDTSACLAEKSRFKSGRDRHIHVCKWTPVCYCNLDADMPNEDCEIHGYNYRRCSCGRFVKEND